MIMRWLIQIIAVVLLFFLSPLLWGIMQTVKARMQGRRGPGLTQTYWTIAKNWRKETTAPAFSSWVFRLSPSVSMAALVTVLILLPTMGPASPWPHNLLDIFFLLALERFWVGLAGLDTAGTFGGLGASRTMTLGSGVEPGLIAAMGVLFYLTGHTTITPLYGLSPTGPIHIIPWTLAMISYAFVLTAELGRLPADNPDTHLELTMIHEATLLESNGRLLAMSQWAMALKVTVMIALGWIIFGPHWVSPWLNLGLLIAELLATGILLAWVESRFAKMRYFHLPGYLALAAGIGMLACYLVAGGLTL